MSSFIVNLTNSTDTLFHLLCYDKDDNFTQCSPDLHNFEIILPQNFTPIPLTLSFLDTVSYVKFAAHDLTNPMVAYHLAPDSSYPACITPDNEFSGPYSFVSLFSDGTCNFAISYKDSQ